MNLIIKVLLFVLSGFMAFLPIMWIIFSILSYKSAVKREKIRLLINDEYSSLNVFKNILLGPLYYFNLYYF
jgi:hypothetical protein